MMNDFLGKTVMVTGGAVRFGSLLCDSFANAGANLIIHYCKSQENAYNLVKTLPHVHKKQSFCMVHADFSSAMDTDAFFCSLPPVDILVNNAAMWIRDDNNANPTSLRCQRNVNLKTPIKLIQSHAMHAPPDACAINILDAMALQNGNREAIHYLRTKKNLKKATQKLACELAPHYRVNAVAPGPMLPPVTCKEEEGMKIIPKTLPLKHQVFVSDVINAIMFLVTCNSATGVVLPIDCGQSLNQRHF